ncbi:MAG TPA: peptidoglycan-binding domain-containing protein [Candidatus Paceibacterota bacterium]|nr:peptidoglycan-binding domain-containing protein [Candidatus Paceibacterota bacterium]
MEKKNKIFRNSVIAASVVILIGAAFLYFGPHMAQAPFCFDFVHDTQFGDRKVEHPSNIGFGGPGGVMYYLPEVPALQKALEKQGFYIDPYETTGGKVYAGAFFGPSTRAAVMEFQKDHGLSETGEATNDVIDILAPLYACPKAAATSTETYTLGTTTPKK